MRCILFKAHAANLVVATWAAARTAATPSPKMIPLTALAWKDLEALKGEGEQSSAATIKTCLPGWASQNSPGSRQGHRTRCATKLRNGQSFGVLPKTHFGNEVGVREGIMNPVQDVVMM